MDDTSTPAPSLEELPPEKGTILELHSTGSEEYDGMVVEFLRADKNPKYYQVLPLKEQASGDEAGTETKSRTRTIESKFCKRPEIKPPKLRELLERLSISFVAMEMEGRISFSEFETRMKGLLDKDPCCVVAYHALGSCLHGKL
ncbi:MAG: hypothetical protein SGARI_000783, partial [Bacillariaceae sp.]